MLVAQVFCKRMYTSEQLQEKSFPQLKKIGYELNVFPAGDRRLRKSWIDAIAGVNPPLLQLLEVSPGVEVDRAQELIIETVETSPGVEVEQAQGVIEKVAKTSPAASVEQVQEVIEVQAQEPEYGRITGYLCRPKSTAKPIAQAAENTPGVEPVEGPHCVECFDDGFMENESGFIRLCQCCSCNEPKLSHQKTQRAIVPAVENSPGVDCVYCNSPEYESLRDDSYWCYKCQPDTDQNPILTGIVLSDRFLARYAPPQSETLHYQVTDGYNVDTDGQLSLFEVQVQSPPEPPDPDDFESLDEFREAIALWDAQNPEPLAVCLDSMCEWAPCPDEWYEPKAEILPLKASSMIELPEQSEVMELSPLIESSITSDFFIPTFDRLGDRSNRSDEPPDT